MQLNKLYNKLVMKSLHLNHYKGKLNRKIKNPTIKIRPFIFGKVRKVLRKINNPTTTQIK